jgi:hypothetical protein
MVCSDSLDTRRLCFSNDKGTNLGYVGSYIYWGVELLILVGVSFAIMLGAASEPFCVQCETWKQERILGGVSPPADEAVDAINQGDLNRLIALNPTPSGVGRRVPELWEVIARRREARPTHV